MSSPRRENSGKIQTLDIELKHGQRDVRRHLCRLIDFQAKSEYGSLHHAAILKFDGVGLTAATPHALGVIVMHAEARRGQGKAGEAGMILITMITTMMIAMMIGMVFMIVMIILTMVVSVTIATAMIDVADVDVETIEMIIVTVVKTLMLKR